jgi:hypothetical protein
MSEHDANRALSDTARLRMLPEPVEDAQPMTFSERQYRAREARGLMVAGLVADSVETQINTIARSIINVETASDAALDALAGIPQREPDFRDGRCKHGNIDFTCHVCAVEQARTHDWGG